MKKVLSVVLILVLSLGVLTGCCIRHDWTPATCTQPETCASCGKTQGEPLGHTWKEPDCVTPETCSVCGETQGKPVDHKGGDFEEQSIDIINLEMTVAQNCTVCGEVLEEKTEALEKLYKDGEFVFSPNEFWERYERLYGKVKERPDVTFCSNEESYTTMWSEVFGDERGINAIAFECYMPRDLSNEEVLELINYGMMCNSEDIITVVCPEINEDSQLKPYIETFDELLMGDAARVFSEIGGMTYSVEFDWSNEEYIKYTFTIYAYEIPFD